MKLDVVAFSQTEGFDNGDGKTNGKPIAPFFDPHGAHSKIYIDRAG